jgi:hypothetical protein
VPVYALDDQVPAIDPEAYVHPDAVVIGNVRLAAGSSVWPGAVLRGDHGLIRIGDRTSIQDGTIIHTTRRALDNDFKEDSLCTPVGAIPTSAQAAEILDILRGLKGLPSRDRLHNFLRAGRTWSWPGRAPGRD